MKSLKKITLVKLGGSVITDKKVPYSAKVSAIKRLAGELKTCSNGLIIAHGSGSFGHTSAAKFGGKKGYKTKIGIAKVARDAMEINRIVMNILIEQKIPAISFRPMSMISANAGKTEGVFFEAVELALKQGLIPVVYGDVILDKKWKSTIYSGETTLGKIALFLKRKGFTIKKIIQIGETNGVYNDKKETISEISKNSWPKIKKFMFKLTAKDVTGGMKHKIEEALKMAKIGAETLIINGNTKNELKNAILGKKVKGTVIK
jgi:isopentenyl phosphate kinase